MNKSKLFLLSLAVLTVLLGLFFSKKAANREKAESPKTASESANLKEESNGLKNTLLAQIISINKEGRTLTVATLDKKHTYTIRILATTSISYPVPLREGENPSTNKGFVSEKFENLQVGQVFNFLCKEDPRTTNNLTAVSLVR
jgi:hypothetical protein